MTDVVDMNVDGTTMNVELETKPAEDPMESKQSTFLLQLYLRVSQMTYAIVAFPIGTVLSIGSVLLFDLKDVTITTIGFWMAGGELVGILCMKLSEKTEDGFIFKRPHDLYFINIALAISLIMMPAWPANMWYMSCIAMVLVQTFNSASKPVVGESIHRLAVLTSKEPHVVFAEANTLRRIGNASIGGMTPLLYNVNPIIAFYAIGGIMLLFLCFVVAIDIKIKLLFEKQLGDMPEEEIDEEDDLIQPNGERVISSNPGMTSSGRRGQYQKEYSTISRLKSYRRRTTAASPSTGTASTFLGAMAEGDEDEEEDSDDDESIEKPITFADVSNEQSSGLKSYLQNRKLENSLDDLVCVEEGEESDESESDEEIVSDEVQAITDSSTIVDKETTEETILSDSSSGFFKEKTVSFGASTPKVTFGGLSRKIPLDELSPLHKKSPFGELSPLHKKSPFGELSPKVNKSPFGEPTPKVSFGEPTPKVSFGEPTPKVSFGEPTPKVTFGETTPSTVTFGKRTSDIESMGSSLDFQSKDLEIIRGNEDSQSSDDENECFGLAYFLIVFAFPFWDAVITRLPFGFVTIAIFQTYDKSTLAALILVAYQGSRALSQSIQVWKSNTVVNYSMNAIAMIAYIVMLTYVLNFPEGKVWWIPLAFTGFSETLPIQQKYLLGLFPNSEKKDEGEDDMGLRNAVKQSHTGTGVGSMAAFILASQIYSQFEIKGMAYCGLTIMVVKIVTNLIIDYIHFQTEKRFEKKHRVSLVMANSQPGNRRHSMLTVQ
uniref:Uncharacterized protein n=1 Tax=Pseudo-nitzschia australis TaxID=44445 RepID=A0A7S4ABZ5_9STRA